MKIKKSFFFSIFLAVSQFYLSIFALFSLLSVCLTGKLKFYEVSRNFLLFLLLLKLVLSLSIFIATGIPQPLALAQFLAPLLILIFFCFFSLPDFFPAALIQLCSLTFYSDFTVNILSLLVGRNILTSNELIYRDTDTFVRFTGLFGSYYSTINISSIAFVTSLVSGSKALRMLSLLSLIFNGAQRSLINGLSLILFWFLAKRKADLLFFIVFSFLIALLVFVITVASASSYPSNALRVSLWLNGLSQIPSGFWFGNHAYSTEFIANSLPSMIDAGISESTALDTIVHMGVPVFSLDVMFYVFALRRSLLIAKASNVYSDFAPVILLSLAFSEYFWGTSFCESFFVSLFIGYLCLSDKVVRH